MIPRTAIAIITLISTISIVNGQCGCQNRACSMNTGYKGQALVKGVDTKGLNITTVKKCQNLCKEVTDCNSFSYSDAACLLLTENLVNLKTKDGVLRPSPEVQYVRNSMFGEPNCETNCACAANACLTDRTFGEQNHNVFPNTNSRVYFEIDSGKIEDCREICRLADECNYISFRNNICYLKWARTNPIRLQDSVSESISKTIIEKHVFLSGDDLLGPKMMVLSLENCRKLCEWKNDCAYWTLNGIYCYLKTYRAYESYASETGIYSGDKTCNFN